jgi:hypothetical protein
VIDASELDRVVRLLGPERVRRDQTVQSAHRARLGGGGFKRVSDCRG